MTVRETIPSLIYANPSLFKARTYIASKRKVLNYIFSVNSTEASRFRWRKGQIVDICYNTPMIQDLPKEYYTTMLYSVETTKGMSQIKKQIYGTQIKTPLQNVHSFKPAFLTETANLVTIPNNVEPDWLWAANEALKEIQIEMGRMHCPRYSKYTSRHKADFKRYTTIAAKRIKKLMGGKQMGRLRDPESIWRLSDKAFLNLQKRYNTDEAIGRKFGITRQAVYQCRKAKNLTYNKDKNFVRKEAVVEAYQAGKTVPMIQKLTKYSSGQVYRILNAANVIKRRK